jgi:hypothetical protein
MGIREFKSSLTGNIDEYAALNSNISMVLIASPVIKLK